MQFGLHLGTRGVAARAGGLKRVAQHCERLGLSHFGLSDHVIIPARTDSRYPYNDEGTWPASDTGLCLEQITALTWAAAATERIRLLTSVMVLMHRPPVLAAKMLATLDTLSEGRLTLGVGVGWMAEELAVLGAPRFDRRGAASDEYIRAF
ncbi:MAG: LLM class flavin-dependent oxidoreductase, partial [Candidatus Tectomicrobia bacterium]|nr:LLM class flavin-dependent oxidoreductase [Candidatus Tectomicrobia bacterium]